MYLLMECNVLMSILHTCYVVYTAVVALCVGHYRSCSGRALAVHIVKLYNVLFMNMLL